jgi:hypothetical protein
MSKCKKDHLHSIWQLKKLAGCRRFYILSLGLIAFTLSGCGEEINPLKDPNQASTQTSDPEGPSAKAEDTPNTEITEGSPPISVTESTNVVNKIADPEGMAKEKSAEIKRSPSSDEKIRSTGVWNLQAHLNDEKINRLNQLRDPSLLLSYPELFGVDLDFEPLITLEGKGPGKVRIIGTNIDPIELILNSSKEFIEVYPYYKEEFLYSDMKEAEEEIEVSFIEGPKEELVDKMELDWSNPREVYRGDNNLNDLIAMVDAKPQKGQVRFKNVQEWLMAIIAGLDKYNIHYEDLKEDDNFLRVRTSKEMRESKKANSYDLCIWLANKAIEHGFSCEIIVMPGYALLAISNAPISTKDLSSIEQSYIDTKMLLDKKTISQGAFEKERNIILERVNHAIETGQKRINEQFELGADNMIALKVEEWDKLYREENK